MKLSTWNRLYAIKCLLSGIREIVVIFFANIVGYILLEITELIQNNPPFGFTIYKAIIENAVTLHASKEEGKLFDDKSELSITHKSITIYGKNWFGWHRLRKESGLYRIEDQNRIIDSNIKFFNITEDRIIDKSKSILTIKRSQKIKRLGI